MKAEKPAEGVLKLNDWGEIDRNTLKDTRIKQLIEHTWQYCDHCDHEVIICGACGNNTCNGGHGTVDGKDCTHCEDAYKIYLDTMNKRVYK